MPAAITIMPPQEVVAAPVANQRRPTPLPPLNVWGGVRPTRPSLASTNSSSNSSERRRHSDSDHLAFEGGGGGGLLADLLLGPRRTARVGSDPGLEPLPSFEQLQGLVASSRSSLVASPEALPSTYDPRQHEDVFASIGESFDEEEEEVEKDVKDMCGFMDGHSPQRPSVLVHSPAVGEMGQPPPPPPATFGDHEVVCVPDSPEPLVEVPESYPQPDVKPDVRPAVSPTLQPTKQLSVVQTENSHRVEQPPAVFTESRKPLEGVAEEAQVSSCRSAECDDDDVFLSPIPTCPLRSRRKHRPEVREPCVVWSDIRVCRALEFVGRYFSIVLYRDLQQPWLLQRTIH